MLGIGDILDLNSDKVSTGSADRSGDQTVRIKGKTKVFDIQIALQSLVPIETTVSPALRV
jgi:hypothetical protein